MSLANRFKNLYRGQLFNFCLLLRFFFLKISLLEILIAFGHEHLKTFPKMQYKFFFFLGDDQLYWLNNCFGYTCVQLCPNMPKLINCLKNTHISSEENDNKGFI